MRTRHAQYFAALVVLLMTPFTQAVELNLLLQELIKRYDIPGMAVAVLDGERVIESAAVGVRVRGGEEQVTLDDLWHLGSCTKAMTATLAARLVEAGTQHHRRDDA